MERREEKTQEINVTTQASSSKSFSHADLIPFDLTREILLRLPSKSLIRFRCVSKLWSSITLDSTFINSFTTFSSAQRSCLMLNFGKFDKQLFFSLSQQKKNLEMCLPQLEKYHLTIQKKENYNSYTQFQSVHGLISFHYSRRSVIWNPSMGQHVTFQKPSKPESSKSYFGYDPIGNTYKVLSMQSDSTNEAHVLTLGVKELWRPIKNIILKHWLGRGICINGVLYIIVSDGFLREIMSFDVRTEKFKLIQTNSFMDSPEDKWTNHSLVSYKGRLAWIFLQSSFYKLWILEDAEKEEWSCKKIHVPNFPKDYVFSDVTDDGEFIYLSVSWKDKEIYVTYYDPLRNSNKRIKIEILEDDDDFWLRRGCYFNDWKYIGSLSNHIENLISLKNFSCSNSV